VSFSNGTAVSVAATNSRRAAVFPESTGGYEEALALDMHERGITVSVVNPSRIKALAQSELLRTKIDALDAAQRCIGFASLRHAFARTNRGLARRKRYMSEGSMAELNAKAALGLTQTPHSRRSPYYDRMFMRFVLLTRTLKMI
jgi:hypothetical protein